MMPKFVLALSLLSLTVSTGLVSTASLAQGHGTDAEQRACARDVQRFCRSAMSQGDMVVLGCLQQNRAKIGKPCDQVLRNHGQ